MPLAKPNPLDDLRLIPRPIEAQWPDMPVKPGRQFSGRLQTVIDRLAELLDEAGWINDVAYTSRHGSLGSELRGALAILRQAHVSLDSAVDQHLLEQRRSLAAQGRATLAIRRRVESLIEEPQTDG